MAGVYDYRSNNEHGLGHNPREYHAHVVRLARTPSVVTDVPHYGNTRKLFSNTRVVEDYRGDSQKSNGSNQNTPQFNEEVEVIDYKETNESPNNLNSEVYEETTTVEADSTSQRRRGFGLCKWKTFKRY
ncbi:hypothetical protein FNV43_RR20284 [Rhamnella rubrinervis]|uniref:Uncharacterized protein n=1 Tax=Rhamnella rubrinervis TaxID=2594499 RepID=A0A8K0GWX2_9ROSA|nr:hypothetical protein FNV43_RR20284 [Rhamnella rubrinervis]